MFKALSNPHRLRILLELAKCLGSDGKITGEADRVQNCQHEFAESLGLAPSTVSHHFKELREAGFLKSKREGKIVTVWIDEEALNSLKEIW